MTNMEALITHSVTQSPTYTLTDPLNRERTVCIYVHIYVHIYLHIHVHIHVHIYMYTVYILWMCVCMHRQAGSNPMMMTHPGAGSYLCGVYR